MKQKAAWSGEQQETCKYEVGKQMKKENGKEREGESKQGMRMREIENRIVVGRREPLMGGAGHEPR